ncbi:MAG TPA: ComEC/Rec2 family competence protein [Gaiellaceae bacterium]
MTRLLRNVPHLLLACLCGGIALANAARGSSPGIAAVGAALVPTAVLVSDASRRLALVALALLLVGWWWGSARLEALDRSVLRPQVGRAERALVEVDAVPRETTFAVRVTARVLRFGDLRVDEPVLLELPQGRAPPQGARLEVLGELKLARGPSHGFDERTWLRRHGVHVVLRGDRWEQVGRRGGLGGLADRLHRWLARSVAPGLEGERRALLEGVVLGEDQGLSDELRARFRAAGLYHLLAVSGQNVALVAGGVLMLAWLLGLPRWFGHLGALSGMACYVLAVGAQPSVVRAGIAGALGSLAWLAARQRDRWYAFLLGAFVLLAWNPYLLLDAGFQLSFAAVGAIFTLVPPVQRVLDGYPMPKGLRDAVAVSTACGVATAPVAWMQFHALPLVTVPANVLAAPVMAPLLGLSFVTAGVAPLAPGLASSLAWLNGWCAAYLAACARFMGGLPGAQVRSGWGVAALTAGAVVAAAYAWQRGERARAGLPPGRQRSAQDRPRPAAPAGSDR